MADVPLRRFSFSESLMRFATSAQVAANQSNAQHSTGPKTWEGKAVSARNNFRHGFTGAFTVLPWEDQNEFDMLLGALREEHTPSGITETMLVDKMAQARNPSVGRQRLASRRVRRSECSKIAGTQAGESRRAGLESWS